MVRGLKVGFILLLLSFQIGSKGQGNQISAPQDSGTFSKDDFIYVGPEQDQKNSRLPQKIKEVLEASEAAPDLDHIFSVAPPSFSSPADSGQQEEDLPRAIKEIPLEEDTVDPFYKVDLSLIDPERLDLPFDLNEFSILDGEGELNPLDSLIGSGVPIINRMGHPLYLQRNGDLKGQGSSSSSDKTVPIGKIMILDKDPDGNELLMEIFDLSLHLSKGTMTYDLQKEAYACDLRLGLERLEQKGEIPDKDSLNVLFKAIGSGVYVDDPMMGLPLEPGITDRSRKLLCDQISSSPRVKAIADSRLSSKEEEVEIQQAEIEFIAGSSTLLGFGLDTTELHLSMKAIGDSLSKENLPFDIRIKEGFGVISDEWRSQKRPGPDRLSTTFRSRGVGKVELVADHPQFKGSKVQLTVLWPIYLILIGVIGGLIGGMVRVIKRKSKGWGKAIGRLFIGMVTGFLLVAAVAVGLGEFGLEASFATTRSSAVVLALIGGYVGDSVFDRLAKKLGFNTKK